MVTMTRAELNAARVAERDHKVLRAAIDVALAVGYGSMTRRLVARQAGVANGSVSKAFGSMDGLRAAVMRQAVADQMLGIVAQGLALADEIARNAPPDVKARALASLA